MLAFLAALLLGLPESPVPERPIPDEQIFAALVPTEAETGIDPEFGESGYFREIVSSLETDFGLSGRRYLVAAVYWVEAFPCSSCRHSRLGVFDVETGALVWKLDTPPAAFEKSLSVFRVREVDPVLTLVYDHFKHECLDCGHNQTVELWLRPQVTNGRISFATVWSGLVDWGNNGGRGGTPDEGCGQMIARGAGRYEYIWRDFVGLPFRAANDGDRPCERQLPERPVEFRRSETWQVNSDGSLTKRDESPLARIDHFRAESFPLNLLASARRWDLVTPGNGWALTSPSGAWVVERSGYGDGLIMLASGSAPNAKPVRRIPLRVSEGADLGARAIGWSADSSRFFVIVTGLTDAPCLLSFGVRGDDDGLHVRISGDAWEGLLGEDSAGWEDGFILRPSGAAAR